MKDRMQSKTAHERYAEKQGRTLISIQGRYEHWHSTKTGNWIYNRDTKRWVPAY